MTDPLFVDCYPLDGRKDWAAFIAAGPPWHGAIFKLTQGTRFEYAAWAKLQRTLFLASSRYGIDLFDGYYHYLTLDEDGALQAEWFWKAELAIGGEQRGTLWGMVDVERGGQRAIPTKARFDAGVGAFNRRYRELSGRDATLYGGELLRAMGEHDRMGAGRSAIALYNATLPADVVARTGADYAHLLFWQYDGDGEEYLPHYPKEAPGCGKIDISAMVLPGGLDALRAALAAPASAPAPVRAPAPAPPADPVTP